MPAAEEPVALRRELGLADAVLVGLGAMLGAGVFAAFAPAAAAAGTGLLLALGIAAVVAFCNATSSAQLAAVHPQAGGTYVYGRRQLGPVWGFTAGWGFVVGKTASCAAMALTAGAYAWPAHPRLAAVAAAAALTAVNYRGVTKTAAATRVLVVATVAVLGVVLVASFAGGATDPARLSPLTGLGPYGVLQAAGLLFFAFAGYARIATLGEEVRDPARTIPRAVPLALGIVVVLYALVGVGVLLVLGAPGVASSAAPLRDAVNAGSLHALAPLVRVGAVAASLGVLLSAMAGVGRTTLAMARDRELPGVLAAVHPRFAVPHRAELLLGAVVVAVVAVARPAGGDRVLEHGGAGLLRDRERLRLDPAGPGPAVATTGGRPRTARLPAPGGHVAADERAGRARGARPRTARPGRPAPPTGLNEDAGPPGRLRVVPGRGLSSQ